jgi:alkanesulfonate monooxygenase SsuD/methylene tetrahydromethanopterin reductase-like flavin-dependent oxidoreductase (luciferase family)
VGDAHPIVATIIAATGPNAQQRLDAELRTWGAAAGRGIGAGGSADVIAQAIQRYAAAGASTVVVQATEDEPDLEGFIAFLGREVRPLLQAVEL